MDRKLKFFRLEDRVLFEAAAAVEMVEAVENDNPNANMNESDRQAQEEQNAVKNAPPENPAGQLPPDRNCQPVEVDLPDLSEIPGLDTGPDPEIDSLVSDLLAPQVPDGDVLHLALNNNGETISTGKELVIINSSVMDADAILSELAPNQEVLRLEQGTDAMRQILDYLDSSDTVYDAIHIVSHGNAGYFVLNGEVIDAANFDADTWAAIGEHISDDGDILLYGCNLAENEAGRELVAMIADASDADVAASDNTTGVGGDWTLEYEHGLIETTSITVDAYEYRLNNIVVTVDADAGAGSLRQAVIDAASGDEITFATGVNDITLKTDEITIDKNLTISGNVDAATGNAITQITANAPIRIFNISSDVNVKLNNLILTGNGTGDIGGVIYAGSGSHLTLDNSTVQGGNTYGMHGGGIYAADSSSITLRGSTVSGNSTGGGNGGGIYGYGNNTITLTDSIVSGNSASDGGGIYCGFSTVILTNSTVSGNSASNGGGIYGGYYNTITLINSTISGNSASSIGGNGIGGGIYVFSNSSITLINSTVAGNAAAQNGGGIYGYSGSTITLLNSIVAGNYGAAVVVASDIYTSGSFTAAYSMFNSNVASSNSTGNQMGLYNTERIFGSGVIWSANTDTDANGLQYLMFGDGTPVFDGTVYRITDTAENTSGTITGTYLEGGVTKYAYRHNNAWYDASGNSVVSAAVTPILVDQVGNGRDPRTATVGAYQVQVNRVIGWYGNADVFNADGYITTLEAGVAHGGDIYLYGMTITLSAEVAINNNVNFIGWTDAGGKALTAITVGGAGNFRVFNISNGYTVHLNNLVLTGGDISAKLGNAGTGGVIFAGDNSRLSLNNTTVLNGTANRGGGIYGGNYSTVTLRDSTVSNNTAISDGGGIFHNGYGNVTLTDSTVSGNTATSEGTGGGGVYHAGYGTLSVTGSLIDSNTAGGSYGGGGLLGMSLAKIEVNGSTISNNSGKSGGGIFGGSNTEITVNNSTIAYNRATTGSGGGISAQNGVVTIVNTTIAGNSATSNNWGGGGIFVYGNTPVTNILNSIVVGNYLDGDTGKVGDILVSGALNMYYTIYGDESYYSVYDESNPDSNGLVMPADGSVITSAAIHRGLNDRTGTISNVFNAKWDNGILVLDDGSLSPLFDGRTMAVSAQGIAAASGVLTGQSTGGEFYFSTDGGATWTGINGGAGAPDEIFIADQLGYGRHPAGISVGAVQAADTRVIGWSGGSDYLSADAYWTSLSDAFASGSRAYVGGDLYLFGLTLSVNSTLNVSGNLAIYGMDNTILDGGGANQIMSIAAGNTVSIENIIFRNGSSANGGAIGNNGSLTVTNTTFYSNTATADGGAIYNAGTLLVVNSTFYGNAAARGGAIFGSHTSASLNIVNSTFHANTAATSGGAIYNDGQNTSILNSILIGNSAVTGGDIYDSTTLLRVRYSVFSSYSGFLNSPGFNNITDASVSEVFGSNTFDGKTITLNTAGRAAANGVIAAVSNGNLYYTADRGANWYGMDGSTGSNVSGGIYSDQLGYGRNPVSGSISIGAVQAENTRIVAWSGAENVEYLAAANYFTASNLDNNIGSVGAGQYLYFFGVEVLLDGTITVNNAINIVGATDANGHAATILIAAAGNRVFDINSNITIDNLIMRGNGAVAGNGGVIRMGNNISLTLNNSLITGGLVTGNGNFNGGGIYVGTNSTLTLNDTAAAGNRATSITNSYMMNGGGIYGAANSTINLTGSTVSGNMARGAGGGIYSLGEITLENSAVSGNLSVQHGGGVYAGGSSATVSNSAVTGNRVGSYNQHGGGIFGADGTTLRVNNSVIGGNMASGGSGGGIYGMIVVIEDSFIGNNFASMGGGGIFAYSPSGVTIRNSTIAGNETFGNGGGIYTAGKLLLVNSTLHNNRTTEWGGVYGGGIYGKAGSDISIVDSTIAGNWVYYNNSGTTATGGGIYSEGALTVINSIVVGNYSDVANLGSPNHADDIAAHGTLNMAYSIFGTGYTPGAIDTNNQSDIATVFNGHWESVNGEWLIADSGNNPVFDGKTMAISADGIAAYRGTLVGAIGSTYYFRHNDGTSGDGWYYFNNGSIAYSGKAFSTDASNNFGMGTAAGTQMFLEAQNSTDPDIRVQTHLAYNVGAYALNVYSKNYHVVTLTEDRVNPFVAGVTLREALGYASFTTDYNWDPDGGTNYTGFEITFDAAVFGSGNTAIVLTLGELVYQNRNAPLLINGSAAANLTVKVPVTYAESVANSTTASNWRVLNINSYAEVTIRGLTISGGDTSVNGNYTEGYGGAIYTPHYGSVTLENVTVTGSKAYYGGGIFGGMVTLENSRVLDCVATASGGGITGQRGVSVTNSLLSGNSTLERFGGGGAISSEVVTVKDSVLSDNRTVNSGGAINSGRVTVINSTLSNNHADNWGGAIYSFNYKSTGDASVSINIINSTISGNTAINGGGAIYAESRGTTAFATVSLTNSTISGNTTNGAGGGIFLKSESTGGTAMSTMNLLNTILLGNYSGTGTVADDIYFLNDGTLNAAYSVYGKVSGSYAPGNDTANVTDATVEEIFANVVDGKPVLENGTLAIRTDGRAAHLGTMIYQGGDGKYYYRDGLKFIDVEGNSGGPQSYTAQAVAQNGVRRDQTTLAYNIGAYALNIVAVKDSVVSTSADWLLNPFTVQSSLRELVNAAADGDTIRYADGFNVLTLTLGEIVIGANLNFADGFNISGGNASGNIFTVAVGKTAIFGNITLNSGRLTGDIIFSGSTAGDAVYQGGNGSYRGAADGVIYAGSYDSLTLTGSGVKTFNGALAIAGDLVIAGSGSRDYLQINGNSAEVTFVGSLTASYADFSNIRFADLQTINSYDAAARTNTVTGSGNINLTIILTADSVAGSDLVYGQTLGESSLSAFCSIRGTVEVLDVALTVGGDRMADVLRDPATGEAVARTITGEAFSGSGYTWTNTMFTVKILPRAITVTADRKTKHCGDADPALTWNITEGSLVGSDSFTGELTRVSGEAPGVYAIRQGTLSLNSNYELSFIGSSLTIYDDAGVIYSSGLYHDFSSTLQAMEVAQELRSLNDNYLYGGMNSGFVQQSAARSYVEYLSRIGTGINWVDRMASPDLRADSPSGYFTLGPDRCFDSDDIRLHVNGRIFREIEIGHDSGNSDRLFIFEDAALPPLRHGWEISAADTDADPGDEFRTLDLDDAILTKIPSFKDDFDRAWEDLLNVV